MCAHGYASSMETVWRPLLTLSSEGFRLDLANLPSGWLSWCTKQSQGTLLILLAHGSYCLEWTLTWFLACAS